MTDKGIMETDDAIMILKTYVKSACERDFSNNPVALNMSKDAIDTIIQALEADQETEEIPEEDCYVCDCGYGWNKKKVIRHHYCPNCGKAVDGKGRWIPCSERLPEEKGFYLVKVCAEYRPIRIYAFSPWGMDEERKFWINDTDSHSHVFNHFVEAWQPLPEPYKAEGSDKE